MKKNLWFVLALFIVGTFVIGCQQPAEDIPDEIEEGEEVETPDMIAQKYGIIDALIGEWMNVNNTYDTKKLERIDYQNSSYKYRISGYPIGEKQLYFPNKIPDMYKDAKYNLPTDIKLFVELENNKFLYVRNNDAYLYIKIYSSAEKHIKIISETGDTDLSSFVGTYSFTDASSYNAGAMNGSFDFKDDGTFAYTGEKTHIQGGTYTLNGTTLEITFSYNYGDVIEEFTITENGYEVKFSSHESYNSVTFSTFFGVAGVTELTFTKS